MACCDLKKNCSTIVCCCLMVLVGIVLIVFSAVVLATFLYSKMKYEQILTNWEQDPITDIYMPASVSTPCQANETPLFSYRWPGISSGCKCYDGSYSTSSCCTNNNTNSNGTKKSNSSCCNGTTIKGIPSQTLDLWDLSTTPSSSNVVRLCAIRLQNYSFKEKAPQQNQCAANEKRCGVLLSSTGNSDYLYCVPTTSKCPIQQIQFSTTPVIDPVSNYPWELVQSYGVQSYSLYVNRLSPTMLPLSQLRVSNSQTTCWDDGESYIPELDFALDLRKTSCSNSDSRYQLTKLNLIESIYFSANSIKSKIDSMISSYQYNTAYPFFLLQKNFLLLGMSCRSNMPQLFSNEKDLDYLQGIVIASFVLCLIYGIELIAFESWIGFAFPKYLWGFIIFRKKANCCLKILYVFKFMLAIACIVVCFILAIKYPKQYNFYKDELSKSCFDPEIVSIFQGFKDAMYPGLAITLIVILFFALCIEPNVIYVFLTCKNPDRYKRTNQYVDNNNNNNANNLNNNNNQQPIQVIQITYQKPVQQVQYPPNQQHPQYPPTQQPQYPINQQQQFIPPMQQQQQPYPNQQPYYGQQQPLPGQPQPYYPGAQPVIGQNNYPQQQFYPTPPPVTQNTNYQQNDQQNITNPLNPQVFNPMASNIYQDNNPLPPPMAPLPPTDPRQVEMYNMQPNNQLYQNNQQKPFL